MEWRVGITRPSRHPPGVLDGGHHSLTRSRSQTRRDSSFERSVMRLVRV